MFRTKFKTKWNNNFFTIVYFKICKDFRNLMNSWKNPYFWKKKNTKHTTLKKSQKHIFFINNHFFPNTTGPVVAFALCHRSTPLSSYSVISLVWGKRGCNGHRRLHLCLYRSAPPPPCIAFALLYLIKPIASNPYMRKEGAQGSPLPPRTSLPLPFACLAHNLHMRKEGAWESLSPLQTLLALVEPIACWILYFDDKINW